MSDTRKQAPSAGATAPDTGKNEGTVQQAANAAQNPSSRAQAAADAKKAGMVKVGCKLPHGVLLTEEVKVEDRFVATGRRVKLNGYNSAKVIGGFGITEVEGDFIHKWMEDNKSFAPVAEGLIFVVGSDEEAEREAEDRAHILTGFEAANPAAPGVRLEPVPSNESAG